MWFENGQLPKSLTKMHRTYSCFNYTPKFFSNVKNLEGNEMQNEKKCVGKNEYTHMKYKL